ncbi:MAG TPA: ATP-binding cassette domain-containing protein [Stellaceae bacterium]|nr:ATP-binding cassette domain-containing protein [Stellaceae bacterium]
MLRLTGLATRVAGRVLHRDINLELYPREVLAVVGASGAGKSVLLKTIVGILPPAAGTIEVFGQDVARARAEALADIMRRWGVMFQDGALFSSLTVAENVAVPFKEWQHLPKPLLDELCALKLALVGLPPESGRQYPAELSGGMRKRAGLARALALDPPLLFLDEPTAGLDPIAADDFDRLVRDLKESLGLTVFMVTHDLDSLIAVADRVAVLVDNRIKIGTMAELLGDPNPWIHAYFHGPRGRSAVQARA